MNNQQLLNTLAGLEEYEADLQSRLDSIRTAKEHVYADILARGGVAQMRTSCAVKKQQEKRCDAVAPVQEELPTVSTARANSDVVLAPRQSITAHLCQLLERYSQGSVTTRNLTVMLMTRQGPYHSMEFEKLRVKVQQAMQQMRKLHARYWRLQWSKKSSQNSQEYFYWWKVGNK